MTGLDVVGKIIGLYRSPHLKRKVSVILRKDPWSEKIFTPYPTLDTRKSAEV